MALRSINIRKAAGPDGVQGRVLQSCADQLSAVFTHIFNTTTLSSCTFPVFLKSKTVLIPKKPTVTCLNNFQPIAFTRHFKMLIISGTQHIKDTMSQLISINTANRCYMCVSHHIPDSPGKRQRILFADHSLLFKSIISNKLHTLGLGPFIYSTTGYKISSLLTPDRQIGTTHPPFYRKEV